MNTEKHCSGTILVTGGAGYIGSHACKALAKAGYVPVSYDNLSRGHAETVKWGPLERGDILDAARLDEVIRQYRPAAVMHFAALAYVGESVELPERYYRNNVTGTLNLLERMMKHDIHNFIFSSSCAVYGAPEQMPVTEAHAFKPLSPYGRTKTMVEQILSDLAGRERINYVSLRYFNAAGADTDGETGEHHDPETHLIPRVLQAAAGKLDHIDIYGDDYTTPDGTCIRDYIHVTDLADAHVRALAYLEENSRPAVYNLGTETGLSVYEIISRARAITGREIRTAVRTRRAGDPPRVIADATKIKRELGWSAGHSDIDTILTTAWQWELGDNGRNID